jgi:molecular chaperone DnaK
MTSALESLSKLGAEFYADVQAAAQAAGAAGGPKGPAEDAGGQPKTEKKADVVDADFEVVDEDKGKK